MRKKIGKYLSVVKLLRAKGRKTDTWEVFNHVTDPGFDDPHAEVSWYSRWRQYGFDPNLGTIWNDRCLRDIAAFMESENAARKER